MPRSSSPSCRPAPSIAVNSRRCAGTAAIAASSSCAAVSALAWASSMRKASARPMARLPSMSRAKCAKRCSPRRRTARLPGSSPRAAARRRACNVVATLLKSGAAGSPLVVMTPRSSWWQSTAERGGGLVAWLESLPALVVAPPARPVVFTANSGHELGHLGLDDFLARRPGWEGPASWVHWGANLGAAGGTLALVSPDDDLRELAAAELTRAGQPHTAAPKTLVPSGETRDIHRKGGRYLTLVGNNPLFHLPQDRWPEAVDLDAVTRIGAAARIVVSLARG